MYATVLKNGEPNMQWLNSLKPLTPLITKNAEKIKRLVHINKAVFSEHYAIIIKDEAAKLALT